MDSIKDVVRICVNVPEFDKHLKVGGHIGRNVREITIKTRTIVRKPLLNDFYLLMFFFMNAGEPNMFLEESIKLETHTHTHTRTQTRGA